MIEMLAALKDFDPITAIILAIIGSHQGWLTFKQKQERRQIKGMASDCESRIKVVRLQMHAAEDALVQIHRFAVAVYMRRRKEKLGGKDGLATDRDTHHFELVFRKVTDEIKNRLRSFCRDNHMADKTEAEFRDYYTKKKEQIIVEAAELIDLYYYPKADPDRVELYDLLKEEVTQIESLLERFFIEARKIAIDYANGRLTDG